MMAKTLSFDRPVQRECQDEQYRITKDGPQVGSFEGLPIGTGCMGTMVWTMADRVCMSLNRSDVYPMNGDSSSFFQRNTDYCGCIGLLDVVLPTGGVECPPLMENEHSTAGRRNYTVFNTIKMKFPLFGIGFPAAAHMHVAGHQVCKCQNVI